ncbi:hypothetical protein NDU88_000288 [Pleurodeles waltl]|uniref:KRAB domain-containing protein n=1 Tax=Pleurodeles waltl TaxID=8319 RepID=A0AAV7P228_PLEWA|nr:hypothetical protein NDU88_000288 [Pleurodeles waltl]
MYQQGPEMAPVTFHDVAAYFSEEDWKFLNEYQKELYKNVIKEIHQALLLLGYQIVNPDTLVRIKKGDEDFVDPQDAATRAEMIDNASCYSATHPDILLRIKQEEDLYCSSWYGIDESGIGRNFSKDHTIVDSDLLFLRKREETLCVEDSPKTDRGIDSHVNTGFPSLDADLVVTEGGCKACAEHPRADVEEDDPVITSVFLQSPKPEEDAHFYEVSVSKEGNAMCYPDISPDILLSIKQEEMSYYRDQCGSNEIEITKCSTIGTPVLASEFLARLKNEADVFSIDLQGSEIRDKSHRSSGLMVLSPDVLVMTDQESENSITDAPAAGGGESSSCSTAVYTPAISPEMLRIKQEEDPYFKAQHCSQETETSSGLDNDHGTTNHKNCDDVLHCFKTPIRTPSSRQLNHNPISEIEIDCKTVLSAEIKQEKTTQCEKDMKKAKHSELQQGTLLCVTHARELHFVEGLRPPSYQ